MIPFSVCMSAYRGDNPVYVERAVKSITVEQTLKPAEVILVVDGPVTANLEYTIKDLATQIPIIKPIWLPENVGLGNALKIAVQEASYEYIMRMDSDDISLPNRFEKQMNYMVLHPEIDVLGGQISEFIDMEDNIIGRRIVPESSERIAHVIKRRCPLNHVSVTLLRSRVLQVGNYLDWHFNEDYYLWIRMYLAGCRFANLPDTLVNVRVGKDMYARRGGWKYFKSEAGLQKYMLSNKMIDFPLYSFNIIVRFIVQVAMSNWLRGFVFQKLFRK